MYCIAVAPYSGLMFLCPSCYLSNVMKIDFFSSINYIKKAICFFIYFNKLCQACNIHCISLYTLECKIVKCEVKMLPVFISICFLHVCSIVKLYLGACKVEQISIQTDEVKQPMLCYALSTGFVQDFCNILAAERM